MFKTFNYLYTNFKRADLEDFINNDSTANTIKINEYLYSKGLLKNNIIEIKRFLKHCLINKQIN